MSETAETKVRRALEQADRERAVASWADGLLCSIRLNRPIKVSEMHQRGPVGRKRRYVYDLDDRMPAAAVDGLYRALLLVRQESEAKAARLVADATAPTTETATNAEQGA